MSTALTSALRESCGYLRDSGYHQTARLLIAAAEEIERLRRQLDPKSHNIQPVSVEAPIPDALRRPIKMKRSAPRTRLLSRERSS
jgi:hypothetical protein